MGLKVARKAIVDKTPASRKEWEGEGEEAAWVCVMPLCEERTSLSTAGREACGKVVQLGGCGHHLYPGSPKAVT